MKDISKIKEKLQKLKSLSKLTNENEMLLAISQMKKLLNKHGLTEEDIPDIETGVIKVERAEIWKHRKNIYTNSSSGEIRRLKDWEKELASAVARAYDCICTFKSFTLTFYGFKEDVMVANEMYQWILNTMKIVGKKKYLDRRRYDKEISPIMFHQSFMMGVTQAIAMKAREIEEEKELSKDEIESQLLQTETSGTSLAIIKKTQIEAAIGDCDTVTLKMDPSDWTARAQGYEAGDEISLRRQMSDKSVKGVIEDGRN